MLAKFIQEQRKKRELKQEFLASALGISRPTYMQIEQGERDLTVTEARKDENGKNIFGVAYEPRHLTGTGTINDYPVKCIPANVMVEFHSSYELDENDYHDVKAICDRFGIDLPDEYQKFAEKEQK